MADLRTLAEELVRITGLRIGILRHAEYDIPTNRRYNKLCVKHQFQGYNKKLTLWRHCHRSCR